MGTGEFWEYWSSILKNTILKELSLEMGLPKPSETKAPMEIGLQRPSGRSSHGNGSPVAICRSSQKKQIYRAIFLRQNVANFNTKLITFWPIA